MLVERFDRPYDYAHTSIVYEQMNIRTVDGIQLAVHDHGGGDKPLVLLIHGYPDTSAVWDGVLRALGSRYRLVTYDVRGAGRSDKPRLFTAYHMPKLIADLEAVIEAVSPERPVHLVGHDWGSIQGWHAVHHARLQRRIASFTSISGPNLDHAGWWLWTRVLRSFRDWLNVVIQLLCSSYIAVFAVPGLAEWLWWSGAFDRLLAWFEGAAAHDSTRTLSDKLYGLKLYRANMFQRLLVPRPTPTAVPVQVLAPERDIYVRRTIQTQAPVRWASQVLIRTIAGRHWVVRDAPELVASHIRQFIERVESYSTTARASRAA